MMIVVSILMVLLFVSGSVILDGWMGRMRDSHPHCRACRYDLVSTLETSDRCPECGALVSAEDAIVWGSFQRNWPRFWVGVLLLITTLFALLLVLSRSS